MFGLIGYIDRYYRRPPPLPPRPGPVLHRRRRVYEAVNQNLVRIRRQFAYAFLLLNNLL